MSNKKATKRALLTSILAICLCLVMLIGSTFAWFTDTASTGVNKIQSGTLKVGLQYKNSTQTNYTDVTEQTNVFKTDTLWEPGHVEYAVLKISNEGNLALRYNLGVYVAQETGSKNMEGKDFLLSSYLQYAVVSGDKSNLDRDELVAAAAGTGAVLNTTYSKEDTIVSGAAAQEVTLIVWMPSTVGNEANYQGETAPVVNLGIAVNATQAPHEYDSFGNDYDAGAISALPTMTTTIGELNTITLDDLKRNESGNAVVEVPMGTVAAADIAYTDNSSGYTGKGVMLGNTNLNRHSAVPAGIGEYTFIFKNGTINSAATGYQEPDGANGPKDSSVYMLVPGNSDVVFENMTFNGVVSFGIQKYTSPWSNLNSLTFKNCTFNGIIVGTCPADNVTFTGCEFTNYTNQEKENSSNPIWWRSESEGTGENANPIQSFTFVNNKVTSTRPLKIERVGNSGVTPVFTFKNNTFDISAQANDSNTKNMAINIGNVGAYTLIDEGNTIVGTTASLYTALTTGSGENKYNAISGNKVLDGNGNPKTITGMVWKTTTGDTFEMTSID